ncbi:MAG: hypothetical protein Ct9H300mP32_6610 [Verrucomicrobiota bacterium]|nr:MAG: hypothetical protein Ct9H300mP32_6610 [Verrucomicrobiota bacterium]
MTTPESCSIIFGAREQTGPHPFPGLANAPRVIDLDLIAFGTETRNMPTLILPHPEAHKRSFVLAPLAELLPAWGCPVNSKQFPAYWLSLVKGGEV